MSPNYSKILLFGEYSVLVGSNALTLPFKEFQSKLKIIPGDREEKYIHQSNQRIKEFYVYLTGLKGELNLNLQLLNNDLARGLYLDSTIPEQAGLGSSGALVAALFKSYSFGFTDLPIVEQGKQFILAESYFHGTSSGIDPLSAYYGIPLLMQANEISLVEKLSPWSDFFKINLFDTGISSTTSNLVRNFLKESKKPKFNESLAIYVSLVNTAINQFVVGDFTNLYSSVKAISEFQIQYYRAMIPDSVYPIWKQGVDSGDYYFKLCGSGGGGYMLVFSTKDLKSTSHFPTQKLMQVYI